MPVVPHKVIRPSVQFRSRDLIPRDTLPIAKIHFNPIFYRLNLKLHMI